MKTIRCSALPRIFACPASAETPEIVIDQSSPDAQLGTAAHKVLARIVREELNIVPYEMFGEFPSVDHDQLKMLCWNGLKIWKQIREQMPEPIVEQFYSGTIFVSLTSNDTNIKDTPDIVSHHNHQVIILDWKSSESSNAYHQLMGYLHLAAGGIKFEKAKLITVWLREGILDVIEVPFMELYEWFEKLQDTILHSSTYGAGAYCRYCPQRLDCPARNKMLQNTALVLADTDRQLVPAEMAELWPKAKQLEQALGQYKDQMRELLEGGALPMGNGMQLALEDCKREKLSPTVVTKAVYESGKLTEDEMLETFTVNKKRLLDAIAGKAERGQKGKVRQEFMEYLRDVGAVEVTEFKKIVTRKES